MSKTEPRPASGPGAGRAPGGLIEHFFRHQYGSLVARLLRRFGQSRLDLVEEAVQEAMSRAVLHWPLRGIPDQPEAWLWRVSYNCALDQLRREARDRGDPAALEQLAPEPSAGDRAGLADDMLAMIFMCCHPAFSRPVRAALTLKTVAGFGTPTIARAFLIPEATLAQRIVRAKRQIHAGEVQLEMPGEERLEGRLDAVLDVIYLIFNEGYSRYGDRGDADCEAQDGERGAGAGLTNPPFGHDLIDEALRLAEMLARHPAGDAAQVDALRGLLYLQSSRLDARLDQQGALVSLADQDRSRWDRTRIEIGLALMARAARGQHMTSFHLLAGIAACHATAPSLEATDWPRILSYYDDLLAASPADVVIRINRAVALSMVRGPEIALSELEAIEADDRSARYAQLPALRAELSSRLGRKAEAAVAFGHAADIASSSAARKALRARAEEELSHGR